MRQKGYYLLTCALVALSSAQASMAQQVSPDAVVYSFEWHARYKTERRNDYGLEKQGDYARTDPLNHQQHNPVRSVPAYDSQRLELPSPVVRPSVSVLDGYESSLNLKNTGTKTIIAVEWEHIFFTDASRQKESTRFRFRREMKIKPEEQKILARKIRTDSNARLESTTATTQDVLILRIEYADGSAWQRR